MTSSSTAPWGLSRASFAGLLTAGIFFGLALVCLVVYAVWRWRRSAVRTSKAYLAQPYRVAEMPYTISPPRHSIMKPPAYFPSPWARDAEDQKVATAMLELKSPPLPGYSVPESMAHELRQSLAASAKTTTRTVATAGSPITPGLPSIVVTSPLSPHVRLPSIPPPLPIPTRDAERTALARYTMPPPTPTCHVTGMPLDLSMRTPPPVYNASMERAQREALRRERRKRKSRWRDTMKSVKSVKSVVSTSSS
ncbi:hypothetical protein CALCODRAFT_512377 [Calocera cornea HHB12733]|uniref:Uncharacterized protein n=1 Tax=Calocera cornea HHB12733 TaxID=1353952 RepID=A0A165D2M7_9BASI|nr:hypothetical protein CALCODRAFT_512377 [Calocera cornea HHB12733]